MTAECTFKPKTNQQRTAMKHKPQRADKASRLSDSPITMMTATEVAPNDQKLIMISYNNKKMVVKDLSKTRKQQQSKIIEGSPKEYKMNDRSRKILEAKAKRLEESLSQNAV